MSEFEYLTLEQVIIIHDSILKCPVASESALASAVNKPMTSFAGFEQYPTLVDKAAALLAGLARNHGFSDANKRTAISCCQIFLYINGVEIDPELSDIEIADFTVSVVEKKLSHDEIVSWLSNYYNIL